MPPSISNQKPGTRMKDGAISKNTSRKLGLLNIKSRPMGERGDADAIAGAVVHPDGAATETDVPVELRLTADDVGLPQVVRVERAAAVTVAVAGSVVEAAVVEAVAPEPQAEVERVGLSDPPLGCQTGRITDDDTESELAAVPDVRCLRRSLDDSQQRHRQQSGQNDPLHGRYSRHRNIFGDSLWRRWRWVSVTVRSRLPCRTRAA